MASVRPLEGKRVVVTRAAEQSGELTSLLAESGANLIHLPVVCYQAVAGALQEALSRIETFEWLIFTSQNAVRFFTEAMREAGPPRGPGGQGFPKVAAVGPATADAAREAGMTVEFVPREFEGRALAKELGSRLEGKRVLLPRSDRARPDLPKALSESGALVTEVICYRTMAADIKGSPALGQVEAGHADVITFASPSAFHAFADAVGEAALKKVSEQMTLAAIGPVTADTIRAAGLRVHVVAEESTAAGLVTALAAYFGRSPVSSGAISR